MPASYAGRGSSWPCRCCSPPSPSAGRSRCRPPTLPAAFDGTTAEQLARELARNYPDRAPGSAGSLGAAEWVSEQLALYGLPLQTDRFQATIPGRGRVELQNVIAVARGDSQRAIVIIAHRDNNGEGRGANDNASGTAALIELARAYAPVAGTTVQTRPSHTLVFVSTDGGAFGALGAARFAERSPYRADPLAVISLDAIAGSGQPRLLISGDTARSPAAALVRTAAVRVLEQTGSEPERTPALRQLLDLGFPFTFGEQGPFVAQGIPAVTLTTVSDVPSQVFEDDPLSAARLGELGRATQNLVGSLDAGLELAQGTSSYVYLGARFVRGWTIELVLLTALLPFVDRRHRSLRPLPAAARSARSRSAQPAQPAPLLGLRRPAPLRRCEARAFPEAEPRPLPVERGLYQPSPVVLGTIALLLLVGWLVVRERLIPRRPARIEEVIAGHTVALLALGLTALVVVATNPFSLIYLLPSLYAWLWLPQTHAAHPLVRFTLLAIGFTGPLILTLSFSTRFDLGLEAPWYLLSLVAVGYVPWIAVLLGLVWLAIGAQLAALTAGRYAPYSAARTGGPRAPFGALFLAGHQSERSERRGAGGPGLATSGR